MLLVIWNDIDEGAQSRYVWKILEAEKATNCTYSDPIVKPYTWLYKHCLKEKEECHDAGQYGGGCKMVCAEWEVRMNEEMFLAYTTTYEIGG